MWIKRSEYEAMKSDIAQLKDEVHKLMDVHNIKKNPDAYWHEYTCSDHDTYCYTKNAGRVYFEEIASLVVDGTPITREYTEKKTVQVPAACPLKSEEEKEKTKSCDVEGQYVGK